jgi:hypothetical protein
MVRKVERIFPSWDTDKKKGTKNPNFKNKLCFFTIFTFLLDGIWFEVLVLSNKT